MWSVCSGSHLASQSDRWSKVAVQRGAWIRAVSIPGEIPRYADFRPHLGPAGVAPRALGGSPLPLLHAPSASPWCQGAASPRTGVGSRCPLAFSSHSFPVLRKPSLGFPPWRCRRAPQAGAERSRAESLALVFLRTASRTLSPNTRKETPSPDGKRSKATCERLCLSPSGKL